MSIRLNGSTSGYTEIDAPAVAASNTLVLPTGNGSSGQFLQTNGSGTLSWGSQRILQVVQTVKTDYFTTSSASFIDITGLSVAITPASSTSKVLVIAKISTATTASVTAITTLIRDTTAIFQGDAAGSRGRATGNQFTGGIGHTTDSIVYLDSPATTSSTTYKIQIRANTGNTIAVNGTVANTDTANEPRTTSSIIVMEVAA
jgi:hypothetical protein